MDRIAAGREEPGAMLTADDVICEIGTPDAFEAVLIIDQGDVQLVREGQAVDMKLDSRRLETFSGMITEKSQRATRFGFDVDVQPNRRRPANGNRSRDRSNQTAERFLSSPRPTGDRSDSDSPRIPRFGKNPRRSDVAWKSPVASHCTRPSISNFDQLSANVDFAA